MKQHSLGSLKGHHHLVLGLLAHANVNLRIGASPSVSGRAKAKPIAMIVKKMLALVGSILAKEQAC